MKRRYCPLAMGFVDDNEMCKACAISSGCVVEEQVERNGGTIWVTCINCKHKFSTTDENQWLCPDCDSQAKIWAASTPKQTPTKEEILAVMKAR
jgi:hypothetical protein